MTDAWPSSWNYLQDFGKIGKQQKDLIYLFMEQRGIHEDGTCWDAIAKIYQRLRNIYLTTCLSPENWRFGITKTLFW
jgi:hypothetical protein